VVGLVVITRRLDLLAVVVAFLTTFGAGVAAVAAAGHGITASWHVGVLSGPDYWRTLVLSPETLIFAGFMITDPRSVPRGRAARIAFAVGVGVLATVLLAPQRTEATTKVAILAALVGACAARPLLEHRVPRVGPRGAVAASLAGVLLVGSAALAAPERSTVTAVERPPVDIGPLPSVEVDPAVDAIDLRDDPEDVATDLLEDLVIEADAIRANDPRLAASAVTGDRLAAARAAIANHGAAPDVPVFDQLTLVLRRDPDDGQAPPHLAVEATGAGTTTYVLAPVGAHWLIADEVPPA
jgi:hypothetical protein